MAIVINQIRLATYGQQELRNVDERQHIHYKYDFSTPRHSSLSII